MKKTLLILFLIPTLIFGQTDKNLRIADTAKVLTGRWLLTTFEKDSLKKEQKIINGEYLELIIKSGRTTETVKKDGLYVIELSFDKVGQGEYQEYFNYQIDNKKNDYIEINECQPVPELVFKNGKIVIQMTYMLGEDKEEIIELNETNLILFNNNNVRRTFKRLE